MPIPRLLLLACLAFAWVPVSGQVAISPQMLDVPVDNRTHAFKLYNLSAEPKKVRVSLTNFDLDDNNTVREQASGEQSLDTWLVVSPLEFTVKPNGYQTVRLSIRPAVELAPGEHRAMVWFDEQPTPKASDKTPTLRVRFRIGAAVYGQVGKTERRGALRKVLVDGSGFAIALANTGNANTRLDGRYHVHTKSEYKAKRAKPAAAPKPEDAATAGAAPAETRLPTTPVLPGALRVVRHKFASPLAPGAYVLELEGTFGETPVGGTWEFEVAK